MNATKKAHSVSSEKDSGFFISFPTENMNSRKKQVFSVLRKFGYLTVGEIQEAIEVFFGDHCNEETALKYRKWYERDCVSLVAHQGSRKLFTKESEVKHYIGNGRDEDHVFYEIPTNHKIAFFLKFWRVMGLRRKFQK